MNKILQLIFLTITTLNAYPEMQDIPPEVLEKMPEEMRKKMGLEEGPSAATGGGIGESLEILC